MLFPKTPPPLLTVLVDGREVARVLTDEVPCEKTPTVPVVDGSTVSFVDAEGRARVHGLGGRTGWAHLSVRVHPTLACQADCVVTDAEPFDAAAFAEGRASGVRFQPFHLPGAAVDNEAFAGKGLFARGLHFSGTVTPSNVALSCECEHCRRSFLVRSYHAGFSDLGYFYSGSGAQTLVVPTRADAGAPAALADPDPVALAALERRLPPAADGSRFLYANPFRCPHCAEPYIDFRSNPGLRAQEYYGNWFEGSELLRYEPPHV